MKLWIPKVKLHQRHVFMYWCLLHMQTHIITNTILFCQFTFPLHMPHDWVNHTLPYCSYHCGTCFQEVVESLLAVPTPVPQTKHTSACNWNTIQCIGTIRDQISTVIYTAKDRPSALDCEVHDNTSCVWHYEDLARYLHVACNHCF
jgi:hypothetical protein